MMNLRNEEIIMERKMNELKNTCINCQDLKKEVVDRETMLKAKDIVDNFMPYTLDDCMLYLASLNTLNTYVKQYDSDITYYFKNNVVTVLLKSILDNDIKGINYYLTTDRGMTVLYYEAYGMMFSFHQVRVPNSLYMKMYNSPSYKPITFDGIRKQKCATTLFNTIYDIKTKNYN